MCKDTDPRDLYDGCQPVWGGATVCKSTNPCYLFGGGHSRWVCIKSCKGADPGDLCNRRHTGWASIKYVKEQNLELCLVTAIQNGLALHCKGEDPRIICDGRVLKYVTEQTPGLCLAVTRMDEH